MIGLLATSRPNAVGNETNIARFKLHAVISEIRQVDASAMEASEAPHAPLARPAAQPIPIPVFSPRLPGFDPTDGADTMAPMVAREGAKMEK
mgnify:CR=1 FL=1